VTATEVMAELEKLGTEQTRKTFRRHGAPERFFGVKVGDLKTLVKKIKVNHPLALELYTTGNADAQYLAGLIADPRAMTKADLDRWAKQATWRMVSEYSVPWVAAESRFARPLGTKWMAAKAEPIAACGWATYASYVSVTTDDDLDLDEITGLLERVTTDIGTAANRVRYTMNGFVIAVGCFVPALTRLALKAAAVSPMST
jgi:3-methyladenine DNA glycosylase AlkD